MMQILLVKSEAYGFALIILSVDVKSAFASMTLSELAVALTSIGIPARLMFAFLADLQDVRAEATVADAPASKIFEFSKGGREGSDDTASPLDHRRGHFHVVGLG